MKMNNLSVLTFLLCLSTFTGCGVNTGSDKKDSSTITTTKKLDVKKSSENESNESIVIPKIEWNQEHFAKVEPNDFSRLYCELENPFSGIGLIETITDVSHPNSWSSNNCTASFVKFRGVEFLITAAHCVVDKERRIKVPVGNMTFTAHHGCENIVLKWKSYVEEIYLSQGASEYFIDEGFDIRADHDWAIIKLRSKSPDYIKKYSLNFEGDMFENAANFGFGAFQDSSGYPSIADGKTLMGYEQNIKKLIYNPILKLDRPTVVGMSGGPIFNLENSQIIGVNSHAIRKSLEDGEWAYSESSLGAYPQIEEIDAIIQQFSK